LSGLPGSLLGPFLLHLARYIRPELDDLGACYSFDRYSYPVREHVGNVTF
jgi:hypothetical protein